MGVVVNMKKLYTFLGMGKLSECIYCYGGVKATPTPFIQLALVELLAAMGDPVEQVVLLATKKTMETRNTEFAAAWQASGITVPYRYLEVVDVPDEENLWILFDQVYQDFNAYDQVYFDITHGFRSFPFAVFPIIHYARQLKDIKVGKILYGNFEARTVEDSYILAPVNDLTDLISLLDWTYGVTSFLETGDAKGMIRLAEQEGLRAQQKGVKNSFQSKKLALQMEKFNQSMATSRGASFGREVRELQRHLGEALKNEVAYSRPLAALLDKVIDKISAFTGDPVLDPFYAVKWCIEHDYIQQAYILLSEHVITVFCKLLAVDDQSFECREAVRRGIRIGGKYSQAEWEKHLSNTCSDLTYQAMSCLADYREMTKTIDALFELRNDLSHAEQARHNKQTPKKIISEIQRFADELEPFFQSASQKLHEQKVEVSK